MAEGRTWLAPQASPSFAEAGNGEVRARRGADPLDIELAARDAALAARTALIAPEGTLTFGALADRISLAVAALRDAGVTPGQRMAFRAESSTDTLVVFLAMAQVGAAWLPIHTRLGEVEIDEVLGVAAPVAHLSLADVAELARGKASRAVLEVPVRARPSSESIPGDTAPGDTAPGDTAPGDAASGNAIVGGALTTPAGHALALMATSGTTGQPKIAVLSRQAFLASAEASAQNLGWTPDDCWLCCMPLAHVGGLSIVTRCLAARRAVVLLPRFDAGAVLETIVREQVTLLSVVPTMLRALLDADGQAVLSRLRVVLVGGAGCPESLREACAARGIAALATYGTTEACSQITAQRPRPGGAAPILEPGSGRALAGVELAIVAADGSRCAAGEIGRIQVRSPARMGGYLGQPPLSPEDWLDTGDLGHLDATGTLFVAARRTDLIVSGGENVYPAEVERVVDACAGVRRSLVFGVPDERWGQRVAVALVVDPTAFSLQALARGLAERLAPHKRPRLACVVDGLPETPAGKVDRRGAPDALGARLRPL